MIKVTVVDNCQTLDELEFDDITILGHDRGVAVDHPALCTRRTLVPRSARGRLDR